MKQADAGDERTIRVFVSSTFRDMQLERDELVKRVFPQVRHLCEQRGVSWSEIDLRWGVTDEQKAEGEVLPICLAEIERTRPYFIGLLGQRYGWVPDELPASLITELGWLIDDVGRSVTELEILHGVLNHPASSGRAYFYLRDDAWVESLPVAERSTFVEESPEGVRRLGELRARVRASGYPTSNYPDPIALGDIVLADLTALVESLYPDPTPPDSVERDDAVHRAFGRSRFTAYVERPHYAAQLDEFARSGGPPVLVTGPSGAGASALVSQWADAADLGRVIVHHVEADDRSADLPAMVQRLLDALRPHDTAAPDGTGGMSNDDPAALRSALQQAFDAADEPTVIVLDGVDRLDDVDGAPDLRWLPTTVPAPIRLILTASGERTRRAVDHRGWPTIDIAPLSAEERRAVSIAVLARFAKALDETHLDSLVVAPNTGNPRFLRVVLDELRQHGDHFTLGDVIARLSAAATIDDLLELVLERYERDFERDRPGLTEAVFTALWAARRGLSERELLAIVGHGDDAPLPQAVWAPLHLAAEATIVTRGGLLGIAHADMVTAIEDRYLTTDEARRAAHRRLAEYFVARPLGDRVVDELGWQQADAGDFDALADTLGDLELAEVAYIRAAGDLRRLWARLEAGRPSGRSAMLDAYRPVVDDPTRFELVGDVATRAGQPAADSQHDHGRQLVWGVARLLADNGHRLESTRLFEHLVAAARLSPAGRADRSGDARLRAALVNLGAAQWSSGDLDRAATSLGEAAARCLAAGDEAMTTAAVGNLALVERDRGELARADALFTEEADACRRLDDEYGLQANLGNHAQLLRRMGRFDDTLALLREQEHLCRNLADDAAVERSLAGQATVLADRGDVLAAIELTNAHAQRCRVEGDLRGLGEALLNLSVMSGQLGDVAAGAVQIGEAEGIARQLGQPELLARVLVSSANLLGARGDWAGAARVSQEAELTARAAGLDDQTALALGTIGTARRELGDLSGARAAHLDELSIAEHGNDQMATATALTNLGNVAIAEQRFDEMYERYAAAERLLIELDVPASLLPLRANRGQVNQAMGRAADALGDLAGAAAAAERCGRPGAVKQWGELAIQLAYQLGDTATAEVVWQLLIPALRALGEEADLQRALGELALLLIGRARARGHGRRSRQRATRQGDGPARRAAQDLPPHRERHRPGGVRRQPSDRDALPRRPAWFVAGPRRATVDHDTHRRRPGHPVRNGQSRRGARVARPHPRSTRTARSSPADRRRLRTHSDGATTRCDDRRHQVLRDSSDQRDFEPGAGEQRRQRADRRTVLLAGLLGKFVPRNQQRVDPLVVISTIARPPASSLPLTTPPLVLTLCQLIALGHREDRIGAPPPAQRHDPASDARQLLHDRVCGGAARLSLGVTQRRPVTSQPAAMAVSCEIVLME